MGNTRQWSSSTKSEVGSNKSDAWVVVNALGEKIMKARAIQTQVDQAQRLAMGVKPEYSPILPVTLGKEYIVYVLACIQDSMEYGMATLYRIVDDHGRLIPMPACVFEISDPRPSKYWCIRYEGLNLSMSPIEFIENPYLSEEIFDGEYAALEQFAEIRSRFELE